MSIILCLLPRCARITTRARRLATRGPLIASKLALRGIFLSFLAVVVGGCATGARAGLPALQQRAVFDLGCGAEQLRLHHIDDRTKVVAGCGRRLIYMEDCATMGQTFSCTWRLDTPTVAQQTWPQTMPAAQTPHQAPARRVYRTNLYTPGYKPLNEKPAPTNKRPVPTELYPPDVLEFRE